MLTKIQITGKLIVETGMHIGGSTANAAIGAVDSPVIKDARTNHPIIPGSSLKGKMRSLLVKEMTDVVESPDNDCSLIARLFGVAQPQPHASRLIFSDMYLSNEQELRSLGLQSLTEVKFENSIDRKTARANPRQIERVIRGSVFDIDIIYNVEKEEEVEQDFKTLSEGFKLLQYDYLGGNGSRGYGKVSFRELKASVVTGALDEQSLDLCNELLAL